MLIFGSERIGEAQEDTSRASRSEDGSAGDSVSTHFPLRSAPPRIATAGGGGRSPSRGAATAACGVGAAAACFTGSAVPRLGGRESPARPGMEFKAHRWALLSCTTQLHTLHAACSFLPKPLLATRVLDRHVDSEAEHLLRQLDAGLYVWDQRDLVVRARLPCPRISGSRVRPCCAAERRASRIIAPA